MSFKFLTRSFNITYVVRTLFIFMHTTYIIYILISAGSLLSQVALIEYISTGLYIPVIDLFSINILIFYI